MEDSSVYGGGERDGGGESSAGSGNYYDRPRFGGPRPFRPSPVRVGEEYDVKIESLSKRGDGGVARVQGLVIFVAGTKVGDEVKIKITKVGRGYATAEIASSGGDDEDDDNGGTGSDQVSEPAAQTDTEPPAE